MSSATFDFLSITTVPSAYSWDDGTPLVSFPNENLRTNEPDLILTSTSESFQCIGYSPFAVLALSSTITNPSSAAILTKRIVNFGDYYNSATNIIVSTTLDTECYNHTYIMPGTYKVSVSFVQYLTSNPFEISSTVWTNTACQPNSTGLYNQPLALTQPLPLFWQWSNFLCNDLENLRNRNITWSQTEFQQPNQIFWQEATPCVNVPAKGFSWRWKDQRCPSNTKIFVDPSTWLTLTSAVSCKTWKDIAGDCVQYPIQITPDNGTSSGSQNNNSGAVITTREITIKVIENPPVAYLHVDQSANIEDRLSPYTVRLSPKYITCGSFPIEEIVWDMGDGSPLLTQKRWSVNTNPAFEFNGEYELDSKDPRNYDVIHTYTKTKDTGFSFYPSLTCYASSTNTSDCAAGIVGPLKLKSATEYSENNGSGSFKLKLLQNELTDSGRVIIGEIGNTVAAWRYDK